jgi:hypothetical protein
MPKKPMENNDVAQSRLDAVRSAIDSAADQHTAWQEAEGKLPALRDYLTELEAEGSAFIKDFAIEAKFAAKKLTENRSTREVLEKRTQIVEREASTAKSDFISKIYDASTAHYDLLEEFQSRRRKKIRRAAREAFNSELTDGQVKDQLPAIDDALYVDRDIIDTKSSGARIWNPDKCFRLLTDLQNVFDKLSELILSEGEIFEVSEWDYDTSVPRPKPGFISPPPDLYANVRYVATVAIGNATLRIAAGGSADFLEEDVLAMHLKTGAVVTVGEWRERIKKGTTNLKPKPVVGKFQDVRLPENRFGTYRS